MFFRNCKQLGKIKSLFEDDRGTQLLEAEAPESYTCWRCMLTSSLQCQSLQMQVPLASAVATGISRTKLLSTAQCGQALIFTGANSPGWDGDQFSNLSPMLFEDEVKAPGSVLFNMVICSMEVRATQEDPLPIRLLITNRPICFFLFSKGRTLSTGGGSQQKTRAAKSAQVHFRSDCNSSQCSLFTGLHLLLRMRAPKDPIAVYPALSRNYMGVWLSAGEPQATILPQCVTLEVWERKHILLLK